jgi:hypothetical protein
MTLQRCENPAFVITGGLCSNLGRPENDPVGAGWRNRVAGRGDEVGPLYDAGRGRLFSRCAATERLDPGAGTSPASKVKRNGPLLTGSVCHTGILRRR